MACADTRADETEPCEEPLSGGPANAVAALFHGVFMKSYTFSMRFTCVLWYYGAANNEGIDPSIAAEDLIGRIKMTEVSSKTYAQVTDVEFAVSPVGPPDVARIAEKILAEALEFCAVKMQIESADAVVDRMQCDTGTCSCFRYGLAKYAAECLGTLDDDIKTVYLYEYEATPEDLCFGEIEPASLIHLITWVTRKTSALTALISAVDRSLAGACADRMGVSGLCHILDVQVIDDADVNRGVGYGGLLRSLHLRPLEIWKRQP